MVAEIQRLREELIKMKAELKKKDVVIVNLQNKLGAVLATQSTAPSAAEGEEKKGYSILINTYYDILRMAGRAIRSSMFPTRIRHWSRL